MLRQNRQHPRLISMHAIEAGVGQPPENEWDDCFPEVHYVEVGRRGRDAGWESVKAIYTQQPVPGEGRARERQVWISFSGSEPTKEELALEWPQDKQGFTLRKLRDWKDHEYYGGPEELKVKEKSGENGRRFWRETTERLTQQEQWRECFKDEGDWAEIIVPIKED